MKSPDSALSCYVTLTPLFAGQQVSRAFFVNASQNTDVARAATIVLTPVMTNSEEHAPVQSPVPPMLTVKETAATAKVSEHTIRRGIARGAIACVHLGRAVRIPAEEVERLTREGISLARIDVDRRIDELVAAAPRLTDQQRQRIAALVGAGGAG